MLVSGTAHAATPPAVNVSYQVSIIGVPLQVAEDAGWWAKAGIQKGKMTTFTNGAQQVAATPSRTWDIALTGGPPSLIGASRFGLQTVLVALEDSRGNALVAKDQQYAAIKADPVAALKGKQYLVAANTTADYAAQACFAKMGLKTGDVQPVSVAPGAIVDAFKSSDIPVGAIWFPHFARMAKSGGKVLCTGKDAGATIISNMVVRSDYLKDNLDAVARFAAMYLRAMNVLREDKARALASMKRLYDQGGVVLSPEEMDGELTSRDYWSLADQTKAFDRKAGESAIDQASSQMAAFLKSTGTIQAIPDPKTYINPVVLDYINQHPDIKAFAEGKDVQL